MIKSEIFLRYDAARDVQKNLFWKELDADVLDKNENVISNTHGADHIIYTLTKINLQFMDE